MIEDTTDKTPEIYSKTFIILELLFKLINKKYPNKLPNTELLDTENTENTKNNIEIPDNIVFFYLNNIIRNLSVYVYELDELINLEQPIKRFRLTSNYFLQTATNLINTITNLDSLLKNRSVYNVKRNINTIYRSVYMCALIYNYEQFYNYYENNIELDKLIQYNIYDINYTMSCMFWCLQNAYTNINILTNNTNINILTNNTNILTNNLTNNIIYELYAVYICYNYLDKLVEIRKKNIKNRKNPIYKYDQ